MAIVNSIIYDEKADGIYQVTVEFLDLKGSSKKGGGENSGKNHTTETAQGASLREALANVSASTEKSIYGGHNHVRFFTEAAARGDMAAAIDYFVRDHLTDETPLMLVIKGDHPENIYDASLGLSDSVGVYIDSLVMTQRKTSSKSVFVTTLDFLKDFFNDGKEPVAGVVEIVKSESAKQEAAGSDDKSTGQDKILCEGLAAFKDDKLVGYFNGIEARAYNLIRNKIGTAILTVPFENSTVVCEITGSSSSIKTKIDGDSAKIDIAVNATMRIIANGTPEDLSDPEKMKDVETQFNAYLLPQIADAIKKAQDEFKSDIFGFGSFVHAQHPQDWQRIKEQWGSIFPKATVNISVSSKVFQTSETKGSILSEFSED